MKIKPNFLFAWIFLTAALALHVMDEALNDFLSIYNPLVSAVNEKIDWVLFPVFSFTGWLASLIIGIIILFSLSFFAYQKKIWILYFSYFYGGIMVLNAMGHGLGSLYYSKFIAGVYSSPLLLVASVYLIWSADHTLQSKE